VVKTPIENPVPVISQFSEILFGIAQGTESYTVAFLPGRIALCGTPGHQFFLNNQNLPAERLHEIFKTRESYIVSALLHKETTTDAARFMESLKILQMQNQIDAHSQRILREFILKCDCPPRRVKDKLRAMGYAHILPHLDFERQADELLTTVEAMERFVESARDRKEPLSDAGISSRRSRTPLSLEPGRKAARGR
jgi:hypothetical protein